MGQLTFFSGVSTAAAAGAASVVFAQKALAVPVSSVCFTRRAKTATSREEELRNICTRFKKCVDLDNRPIQDFTMDVLRVQGIERKQRRILSCRFMEALKMLYAYFSFAFVHPLLEKGDKRQLEDVSAMELLPKDKSIEETTSNFQLIYNNLKVQWNKTYELMFIVLCLM